MNELVPVSTDDPRVKPVAKEVAGLTQQAEAFQVTDADSYEHGAEVLRSIKSMYNTVETKRKAITSPLDQAKRQVMDLFRPFTDSLSSAERTLKKRLIGWKNEQERIAREEQRKAEEAARKERERLEKQAAKAEEAGRTERAEVLRDRAEFTVPVAPAPATPKVSGLSDRKVWRFEIVDAAKIPREYLIPDEKRIGGVVRALKQDANIPGVRVYEESTLAARRA